MDGIAVVVEVEGEEGGMYVPICDDQYKFLYRFCRFSLAFTTVFSDRAESVGVNLEDY